MEIWKMVGPAVSIWACNNAQNDGFMQLRQSLYPFMIYYYFFLPYILSYNISLIQTVCTGRSKRRSDIPFIHHIIIYYYIYTSKERKKIGENAYYYMFISNIIINNTNDKCCNWIIFKI